MEEKQYRASVKLIKGKDHYRWEIDINGDNMDEIIQEIERVDTELNERWVQNESEKES